MSINLENYQKINSLIAPYHAQLVAVSKTKPVEDILSLMQEGQIAFGENYVQELTEKHEAIPENIEWHFIGHLQSNKVKYIHEFVHLIHGIDSLKLLNEVNKQAEKSGRTSDCLLQIFIADEATKFGLDEKEATEILELKEKGQLNNIRIRGLMGMASFTEDQQQIKNEFSGLKKLFDQFKQQPYFDTLSMGMSGDYQIALDCGSTMIRIGSALFGARNYNK